MLSLLFLVLINLLPAWRPVSGIVNYPPGACLQDPQCTGQTTCCCSSYSENDPWDPRYRYCPCLTASSSNIQIGAVTTLTCNPGFGCLDGCSWITPQGTCRYDGQSWSCDGGVTGVTLPTGAGRDNCDITVLVEDGHMGNWTCQVRALADLYADHVTLNVSSTSYTTPATKTESTTWIWMAIVLPILLVLLIVLIVILVICCCCPGACAGCCGCCPGVCACCPPNRQERVYDEVRGGGGQTVHVIQQPERKPVNPQGGNQKVYVTPVAYKDTSSSSASSEEDDQRSNARTTTFRRQSPDIQVYPSRRPEFGGQPEARPVYIAQNPDPRGGYAQVDRRGRPVQYGGYAQEQPPTVIYQYPRMERDETYMKTARKVSSNIGPQLPDKVRRASGNLF